MSEETTTPVEETTEPVETAPDGPQIATAFLVAIDVNGGVYLERNTDAFKLPVEREVSLIEVRRYLSEILMDLQAQAAAEYTVTALNHQAAAAQAPAN